MTHFVGRLFGSCILNKGNRMAQKVVVENREWNISENRLKYCKELERGNILFFPSIPFPFPQEEINFLLEQRQSKSAGRKNIAYKPQIDKITNHDTKNPEAAKRIHQILRRYSQKVTEFLKLLLPAYSEKWRLDYASFRPFQEKGRNLRVRARNDLLHVDSFPTRPLHGARILRFFTNINPTESRRWITSRPFSELAEEFGGHGVLFPKSIGHSRREEWGRKFKRFLHQKGFKIPLRSPYDQFMMQLHNFLKENENFQKNCPKDSWDFPPSSCWAVFTDQVSHAALSGQFALEQTLIVPPKALIFPEEAPVAILERLSGRIVIDPLFAGLEK